MNDYYSRLQNGATVDELAQEIVDKAAKAEAQIASYVEREKARVNEYTKNAQEMLNSAKSQYEEAKKKASEEEAAKAKRKAEEYAAADRLISAYNDYVKLVFGDKYIVTTEERKDAIDELNELFNGFKGLLKGTAFSKDRSYKTTKKINKTDDEVIRDFINEMLYF